MIVSTLAARVGASPKVARAVVTHSPGLPPSVKLHRTGLTSPIAAWAGPRRIYVVAWGSGSCPQLPTTVYADRHNDVTVRTNAQTFRGDACTCDLSPTTSTVNLPDGLDLTKLLRVNIDGTVTTLDPA